MVMHTVQALAQVPQLTSGWLVVSPSDEFAWPSSGWPEHFRRVSCGGATRAESVFNGLSAMLHAGVAAQDWVLVHDAARCLITPEAVSDLVESCRHDDVGGLLALPLPDTLKAHTLDGRILLGPPDGVRKGRNHSGIERIERFRAVDGQRQ